MSIYRVKLAEEKKFIPKKDVVKKEDVEFTSSKSEKPFSPADEEPDFDPSREFTTTIPSEIQAISALTKEQQKHIMSVGKKEDKANDPEYVYYVLNKAGDHIRSGWTCKEDAIEGKADDDPDYAGRIVHKKTLKQLGIDPEDNSVWRVDYQTEAPEEKKASRKPTLIGKELKLAMSYLASTTARDDVFYAEEKDEDKEE